MGILQAIGRGFSQSKKILNVALVFFAFNFVLGLVMLPFVPAATTPDAQAQTSPTSAAASVIVTIIGVVLFIFLQGGALGAIRDLLKKGAFSLSEFAGNGKKYYVKILGLLVSIIAIALVAVIIIALIAAGILALANNPFTRALILAFITIVGIGAAVMFLFPIYSVVVDEIGPIAAIKKGVSLSLKKFWKTLGLAIVLFVLTFVIAVLIMLLPTIVAGFLPAKAGQVLMLLINSVIQSYLSVVIMTALMAYYLSIETSQEEKGPVVK